MRYVRRREPVKTREEILVTDEIRIVVESHDFADSAYYARALVLDAFQELAIPTAKARTREITPTRSVTEIAPRASRMLNRCEHFRHRS